MSQNQSGPQKKQPSAGKVIALGAIATALAAYNFMPGGEEPRAAVKAMEWLFLALGLIGLGGGLIMYMNQK